MKQTCKHCGTRYSSERGHGDFCCAGCEHVYGLIQSGGLGDYYRKQDRVGHPVGDSPHSSISPVLIKQLQGQAESVGGVSRLTLGIHGLSCMGCVWLVEQLARRQPGTLSAKVALSSNRMSLVWEEGAFDLNKLAGELQRFGYHITEKAAAFLISPLAMRAWLTLVFSLNGLFLSLVLFTAAAPEALGQLLTLLVIACAAFSFFLGGALFVVPAWRGLRLRRFHSDLIPSIILAVLFCYALVPRFFGHISKFEGVLFFVLLPTMVMARWLSELWALRREVN